VHLWSPIFYVCHNKFKTHFFRSQTTINYSLFDIQMWNLNWNTWNHHNVIVLVLKNQMTIS
jgi:hypothetical protein